MHDDIEDLTAVAYHHGAGLCGYPFLEEDIMDNRLIGPETVSFALYRNSQRGNRTRFGHARLLKSEVSFETQPNYAALRIFRRKQVESSKMMSDCWLRYQVCPE